MMLLLLILILNVNYNTKSPRVKDAAREEGEHVKDHHARQEAHHPAGELAA